MTAHASAARTDNVFARAAAKVAIEDYCAQNSAKLKRSGGELRGPCILCDGGTTKFAVKGDRWRCYGCERHGDVSDLVGFHRHVAPYDAARWLLGEDVPVSAPRERRAAPDAAGPKPSDLVAAEIWREAQPFKGSLAERYLIGRGISAGVVMLAAERLRYHAAAKHHWDERARIWVRAPAMVAQVVVAGPDGEPMPTGGVHCTYLDRATGGKAALEPAKRMWGPQQLDGKAGGAWLIGPHAEIGNNSDLVVAEGIETALSLASIAWIAGQAVRACAALSLSRLQGGVLRDDDGCFDPQRPMANPDAPAFTWPCPERGAWPRVLIGVDRDMSPVKIRARTGRGRIIDMRLEAEARARICGRMAGRAWKAAGAREVQAIAPPPGQDFNDDLRRVLARGSDA